ncbi:MAG: DNA adenine methylase [Mesorhizobium sp.]
MQLKPFLKWAGGKRWLMERGELSLPQTSGRYIEPFLGGAAAFFHFRPERAFLSDANARLIETYQTIASDWSGVWELLNNHHKFHSIQYYYEERGKCYTDSKSRAAQFVYLNRTCWNGLYRENLRGEFNVPIGTKSSVVFDHDDFEAVSQTLSNAEISCCDFSEAIELAESGDFLFIDPPYTTAHNFNGFVKYNQNIFSWDDQVRLRDSVLLAVQRGANVLITNADHPSIYALYASFSTITRVERPSVISGKNGGRGKVTEAIIRAGHYGQ